MRRESQIAELRALGILGKTPGGTQWREKAKHGYNTRAAAAAAADVAKPTGDVSERAVLATFKV